MNYSIEAFKLSDWKDIEPREELRAQLEDIKKEILYIDIFTKGMPFFTLRADGEIIVIYGMLWGGSGTYVPSVIAGKNIKKHLRKVIQIFYEYFATYVPRTCRRMEAHCDIMDTKAILPLKRALPIIAMF